MALEYTLYMTHDGDLVTLCDDLAREVRAHTEVRHREPQGFTLDALWVAVRGQHELSVEITLEEHGIETNTYALLRLDKFNVDAAYDSIGRVVTALLSLTTGDVVQLFNGELPVLRREAGVVHLREGVGLWSEARRAWLGERLVVGGDFGGGVSDV